MKRKLPKTLIFMVCYIAYTCAYVARLNLSMAAPEMIAGGVLTQVEYGFMGSAFFITYACGRLLNGMIGDRCAPWIMVGLGLMLTGLANLTIGFLPPYAVILLLWCINAYAQSMLWSSMLRCMTGLYGKSMADRKVPILVSSVSVGNIVGIVLSTWMVKTFGIRAAFFVPGAMTVVLSMTALWVLRVVPEAPKPEKQRFWLNE